MTQRAMAKLEKMDPARAILARQMSTYLNHLQGCAERDDLSQYATVIRAEEGVLEARLGGLRDIPRLADLSGSDVMAVCGPGSTR